MSPAKNEGVEQPHWTLDRRVPIASLAVVIAQTVAVAWWAATLSTRVDQLESAAKNAAPQAERIVRLEEKLNAVQEGVKEIKVDMKTLLAQKSAATPPR